LQEEGIIASAALKGVLAGRRGEGGSALKGVLAGRRRGSTRN